ncbi:SAMP-activating enzyme E1 [uncultured archaeon]|nr:SAMP-activating enzyme E1 [uncultured archaeon]
MLPGIIGTIQASEALKFVLGIGELLVGRLLCFNALDMTFYEAAFGKRKDCALCGEEPEITRIEHKNYLENGPEECGL